MATQTKISASRLKMLNGCSWQYYCRYILKLPDKTNSGALMGSCCHSVFECLLKPRHRRLFDAVVDNQSVLACPSIARYVKHYCRKHKLEQENVEKIYEMILVGLNEDFFCKGGEMLEPELSFDITSKHPKYRITGFIDQPAKYNDKFLRIKDYKSSKKKFEGEDLTINLQGMMYSLAVKKMWPNLIPIVDFVFLQFPEAPIQRLRFSDAQLLGFELMLEDAQRIIDNFTEETGRSNFASKQKFTSGKGFKGPLMCGWAGRGFVTSPTQRKKDGSLMFHCPYRFPFKYFALCNQDGEVIRSSKERSELTPNEEKGEFVIEKKYGGCPGHD